MRRALRRLSCALALAAVAVARTNAADVDADALCVPFKDLSAPAADIEWGAYMVSRHFMGSLATKFW